MPKKDSSTSESELATINSILVSGRFAKFLEKSAEHLSKISESIPEDAKPMSRGMAVKTALECYTLIEGFRERALKLEEQKVRIRQLTAQADMEEQRRDTNINLNELLEQAKKAAAHNSD